MYRLRNLFWDLYAWIFPEPDPWPLETAVTPNPTPEQVRSAEECASPVPATHIIRRASP